MKKSLLISLCSLVPVGTLMFSALTACAPTNVKVKLFIKCNTDGNGTLVGKADSIEVYNSETFSVFKDRLPFAKPNLTYTFDAWYLGNKKLQPTDHLDGEPESAINLTAHFVKADHYDVSLSSTGSTIVEGSRVNVGEDARIVLQINHIYAEFDTASLAIKIGDEPADLSKFVIEKNEDKLIINIPKEYIVANIDINVNTKVKICDVTIDEDEFEFYPKAPERIYSYMLTKSTVNFDKDKLYKVKISLKTYQQIPIPPSTVGGSLFSQTTNEWRWLHFYNDVLFTINGQTLTSNQYSIQPDGPSSAQAMNGNYQINAPTLINNDAKIEFIFMPKENLSNGQISFFIE